MGLGHVGRTAPSVSLPLGRPPSQGCEVWGGERVRGVGGGGSVIGMRRDGGSVRG